MPTPAACIVIAWTETDRRVVNFESCRVDLGERPETETIQVARAVVWLLSGNAADVGKAEKHAATIEGAKVFTFGAREADPIGRGKRAIMARTTR